MKRGQSLPADVRRALAEAERSPGWNMRAGEIRRFAVGACTLFVVPYRRWAYRRQEQRAAEWHRKREAS